MANAVTADPFAHLVADLPSTQEGADPFAHLVSDLGSPEPQKTPESSEDPFAHLVSDLPPPAPDDSIDISEKIKAVAPYAGLAAIPILGKFFRFMRGAKSLKAPRTLEVSGPSAQKALPGSEGQLALPPGQTIAGEGFTAKPAVSRPVLVKKERDISGFDFTEPPIQVKPGGPKATGKVQTPTGTEAPGGDLIFPGGQTVTQKRVEEVLTKPAFRRTAEERVIAETVGKKKVILPAAVGAYVVGTEEAPAEERTNVGSIVEPDKALLDVPRDGVLSPNIILEAPAPLKGIIGVAKGLRDMTQAYSDSMDEFIRIQDKQRAGEMLTEPERKYIYDTYSDGFMGFGGAGFSAGKQEIGGLIGRGTRLLSQTWEKVKKLVVPRYRQPHEYVIKDLERLGKISLQKVDTDKIVKPLKNLNADERLMSGEALKGNMQGVSKKVADAVAPARKQIDRLSAELAKELDPVGQADLINEINSNVGQYVRRTYARDILGSKYVPTDDVVNNARKFLKGSMEVRDPVTKKARSATGIEIENAITNITAGRDSSLLMKSGGKRINVSPLMKRKDIPKPIRDLMGEVTEGSYAAGRTIGDLSSTLHNIRFFKNLAKDSRFVSDVAKEGFTTAPIPHGNARFGALRGKFVLQEIADDLNNVTGRTYSEAEELYFTYMSSWKYAKTVLNLPTHGRNVLGNVVFSDMASISPFNPKNARYFKQAAFEISNQSPIFREAVENSAVGTEFFGTELKPMLHQFMSHKGGPIQSMLHVASKAGDEIGRWYNLEDQIPKMASFLKQRELGMTAQQAGSHVRKWFPNYRDVAPAIDRARGTVIGTIVSQPFISFTGEATRIYANALKERPVSFFKWAVGIPGAMTGLAAYSQGLSLEDMVTVHQAMPKDQQFKYQLPVPWRDKDGSLQTFDMSYIVPLGDALQARGMTGTPLLSQFVGGHPVILTLSQIRANKNYFTGGPISRPSDVSETLSKVRFAAEQLLPIPPTISSLGRLSQRVGLAEFGGKEKTTGEAVRNILSPLRTDSLDQRIIGRKVDINRRRSDIMKDLSRVKFAVSENRMFKKDADKKIGKLKKEFKLLGEEAKKLKKAIPIVRGKALE